MTRHRPNIPARRRDEPTIGEVIAGIRTRAMRLRVLDSTLVAEIRDIERGLSLITERMRNARIKVPTEDRGFSLVWSARTGKISVETPMARRLFLNSPPRFRADAFNSGAVDRLLAAIAMAAR